MSLRSVVIAAFASVLMLSSVGAMAQSHGGVGGHGGGGGFHGGGGYHGGGFHGGGWGHSSVFIGGDFGWPGYAYGYGYDPYYYYDAPPVVYAPPAPAYYGAPAAQPYPAPPIAPQVQAPVAANGASGTVDQSYCRQYQGTVMVDGATQPSTGVACRQPNGSWRIVQ